MYNNNLTKNVREPNKTPDRISAVQEKWPEKCNFTPMIMLDKHSDLEFASRVARVVWLIGGIL